MEDFRNSLLELGFRLREFRERENLLQGDLASEIGMGGAGARSVISRWEKGRGKKMPPELLLGICRAAYARGYSLAWLLLGEGERMSGSGSSAEVADYLDLLEATSPEAKRLARETLRLIEEIGRETRPAHTYKDATGRSGELAGGGRGRMEAGRPCPPFVIDGRDLPRDWQTRFVPIINSVAAGMRAIDTTEATINAPGWAQEYVEFPGAPARSFALRVLGGSMQPMYASGDILIVDPGARAIEGEPAVVAYRADHGDDDAVAKVKVWRRRGARISLESLAKGEPAIHLSASQVIRAYAVYAHLPLVASQD